MTKIYKVGGCVRDKLLGIESKDIDFTYVVDNLQQSVEEGFKEMQSYLIDNNFKIFLETPECYTIRSQFPENHQYARLVADFVLARKEVGYIEGTRRPILLLGTLKDDLLRRDFTINAMAEDELGNLIDPFGGQQDLKDQILLTPLNPIITMMDDPLRILRALRFSITKKMTIPNVLFNAFCQDGVLEKLEQTISSERIREEIYKMMNYDTIQSLFLLHSVNIRIPGFLQIIFKEGLWLKPTFKQK